MGHPLLKPLVPNILGTYYNIIKFNIYIGFEIFSDIRPSFSYRFRLMTNRKYGIYDFVFSAL